MAMAKQEVFDKVAAHLLTQKARAFRIAEICPTGRNEEICQYRAPDGKRCAIGCLIPDEWEFALEFEGSVAALIFTFDAVENLFEPGLTAQASEENLELLDDFLPRLQHIHDGFKPFEWWGALHTFAIDKGLNADVLDRFALEG
jgi:hypothetical protein